MSSSFEISAENIIRSHLKLLQREGFLTSKPQKGNYHFEADINKGSEKIKLLVYFGRKGNKTVLQGKTESGIYREASSLIFGPQLFTEAPHSDFSEPENYIGTDESGKGDLFGPLVIAGVSADKKIQKNLVEIGVKDSKLLSDTKINLISKEIKKIAEKKFSVILITPKTYNKLYADFRNLNRLLGWGHAKVLENILETSDSQEAISDKFGDEKYIIASLQQKGKNLLIHQRTKAEKYSAVAAASILARAAFNTWFERISKELKIKIPKGASAEAEKTAILINEKFGAEKLNDLTKLHFKTIKRIIS